MRKKLYHGDCLEILDTLPANKIDTCITDPPYELGFMGKDWDSAGISFRKETWEKVYRVLKPGAFLLAFGGTRTWHRIAVAIENAGFEIRDTICWLQGQGFPKSYDISKGIDKKAGKEREIIEERYKSKHGGGSSYQWSEMENETGEAHITAPATPEAELWEGWGTALKPAFEPIIVAMKPRDGTYVENALKHGVAGLWIDGGRIGNGDDRISGGRSGHSAIWNEDKNHKRLERPTGGRWPSNVILSHHPDCKQTDETITVDGYTINRWKDNAHPFGGGAGNEYESEQKENEEIAIWKCVEDCPVRLLNEQTGILKSGLRKKTDNVGNDNGDLYNYGIYGDRKAIPAETYGDSGGASRFFYCAKANKKERNAGLDNDEKNAHPTVKPLALMEYLCKLTCTPTGGIVLDPFMGSGTTGMACVNTDRDFIGIDNKKEHYIIARKRIEHAKAILS